MCVCGEKPERSHVHLITHGHCTTGYFRHYHYKHPGKDTCASMLGCGQRDNSYEYTCIFLCSGNCVARGWKERGEPVVSCKTQRA